MQTLKQVSEQRLTSQNMSTQNMSLLGHRTLGFDIETSGLNDPADSIWITSSSTTARSILTSLSSQSLGYCTDKPTTPKI